jgi:hypothetical protein
MKDPIHTRLLPGLPSIWKLLVDEHRPDMIERKCWLAIDLLCCGVVGQECEQQAEFSSTTNEIIFSQQLGDLLVHSPVAAIALGAEDDILDTTFAEIAATTPSRSCARSSATVACATFALGSLLRFWAMNRPTSDRFRQPLTASDASRSKSSSLSRPEARVFGFP